MKSDVIHVLWGTNVCHCKQYISQIADVKEQLRQNKGKERRGHVVPKKLSVSRVASSSFPFPYLLHSHTLFTAFLDVVVFGSHNS